MEILNTCANFKGLGRLITSLLKVRLQTNHDSIVHRQTNPSILPNICLLAVGARNYQGVVCEPLCHKPGHVKYAWNHECTQLQINIRVIILRYAANK